MERESLLHVGCGRDSLPSWLSHYSEIRMDIDPDVQPDIVGDMTAISAEGPFDAIACFHALEHLHREDVDVALAEFKRVLRDGGVVYIIVPDIEDIKPTDEVLYESSVGPITGVDVLFGYQKVIKDKPYMAHKCGFTRDFLDEVFQKAGFSASVVRRVGNYNLLAVGVK